MGWFLIASAHRKLRSDKPFFFPLLACVKSGIHHHLQTLISYPTPLMEKTQSPYKTRKKPRNRINSLPTEIQTRILSFLPDTEALQTRILSQQWKNLPPSLFIQSNLPHSNSNGEINTINITLHLLQGFNIQTLKIHSHHLTDPKLIQDLHERISFIFTRNIIQLELVFSGKSEILPCLLFTCETLMDLKLRGVVITELPVSICFRNLKTLTLEFVEFWNQEVITEFFNGCLALEVLNIRYCKLHCGDDYRFTISSPNLKALEIDSSFIFASAICISSAVEFSFSYKGFALENLVPIMNLRIASFTFVSPPCVLKDEKKKEEDCAFKILEHMPKIVRLSLLGHFLEYLLKEPDLSTRLPGSDRLQHLELEICPNKQQVRVMTRFLSVYPNLQTLSVVIYAAITQHGENKEPQYTTDDVLKNLREVEVKLYEGCERELDLVKYFLGNARVLEKMNIMLPEKNRAYMMRKDTVNMQIQKFGRAYPDVVISVSLC